MNDIKIDKIYESYVNGVNKFLSDNDIRIKDNLKITKDELKLGQDVNSNLNSIKDFLRYRIFIFNDNIFDKLNKEQNEIYKNLKDFDIYDKVIKCLEEKFSNGEYKVEKIKKIKFKVDEKYLFQTDTAESFKGIFYQYLKDYHYTEFMAYEKTDEKLNKLNQLIYLLRNIDKILENDDKDLLELFNQLAYLYHTIDNIVLVPNGFNSKRGLDVRLKDIYPLSISYLIRDGFNGIYYDKKLICTLGLININFSYDNTFYEDVSNKLWKPHNDEILDYRKYLKNSINYIKNHRYDK